MKNILLIAVCGVFTLNVAAQLTVKPTAAAEDSYVFVNDVILYVKDDVNLTKNPSADTEASIYLRGDGQLFQDAAKTASTNTGDGQISVWQHGFANAFDYNYWASPVGNPTGTGNQPFGITMLYDALEDTGNVGFEDKTHSTVQTHTTALNGVASSVANGDSGTMSVSDRWIYTLNQSGYANWSFIGANATIPPGQGFTMKGTGTAGYAVDAHNQLYDFRGRPNDGDISVTFGNNANDEELLAGNPYPSTIDMAALLAEAGNDELQQAVYYWDQSRTTNSHNITDYQGGYGTWVPNGGPSLVIDGVDYGDQGVFTAATFFAYRPDGTTNGGGTAGAGGTHIARFAPPGQGFVLRSNGTDDGTVTFKNNMRTYIPFGAGNGNIFKGLETGVNTGKSSEKGNITTRNNSENMLLRFRVEINDLYVRDMVLTFNDNNKATLDEGWDAKHPKLINQGDIYWRVKRQADPYVIYSTRFNFRHAIPLGVKLGNGATSYKIKLDESINFDSPVYLFDYRTRTYQDITTETAAVINLSGNNNHIKNRYAIVFNKRREPIMDGDDQPLDIADVEETAAKVKFFQNNRNSQLEIFNPSMIEMKAFSLYDMAGKLVMDTNIDTQNKYAFSTASLSNGVYLVKLVTQDDVVIDYKATVHNKN